MDNSRRKNEQSLFESNQNICVVIAAVIFVTIIYFFFYKSTYEHYKPYQCDINKIARENEIYKDRYPYQDVSQRTVAEQRKDYNQTMVKPKELADNYEKTFPDDLLPQEKETTDWSRSNPPGKGSLELKNMLAAGQHIGVNTQGSSMKNANQQIRSEAPNPIVPVSIFNNSSITPDIFRKPLEIGEATTA